MISYLVIFKKLTQMTQIGLFTDPWFIIRQGVFWISDSEAFLVKQALTKFQNNDAQISKEVQTEPGKIQFSRTKRKNLSVKKI